MPKLLVNLRQQRSLITTWWRTGRRVLSATQEPVLELAGNIPVDELKARVPRILKPDMTSDYIRDMWVSGGSIFAVDMIKRIQRAKKQDNIDYWEDHFRAYMRERSMKKALEIMDTQAQIVNDLIDRVLDEGFQQGLGIDKIQRMMRDKLTDGLTMINRYQAQRIAQTEIMGASNTGSFEGAKESGVALGKEWLSSGLPNVRPSHQEYEAMGTVDMDYEYNTGLQYPCDPNGEPGEIINCHCVPTYSVD